MAVRVFCLARLSAGHLSSGWAFVTFGNLKRNHIAYFEILEHNANELLGVKEKVLIRAFARNETISFVRQGLDCTCRHLIVDYFKLKPSTLFLCLYTYLL